MVGLLRKLWFVPDPSYRARAHIELHYNSSMRARDAVRYVKADCVNLDVYGWFT